jgi:hypothetical protein
MLGSRSFVDGMRFLFPEEDIGHASSSDKRPARTPLFDAKKLYTESISLAINSDGRLELFMLGADGGAYHRWQTAANGCCGESAELQGHSLQEIAAATNQDGRLELFALGALSQVADRSEWGLGRLVRLARPRVATDCCGD